MSTRRKLLFISAGPLDHPQLRSGAELREITSRIREALPAERFTIEVETAAKRSELAHLLLFHKPEIVHFSGHGESKKGILLEDERGRAAAVDGKSLAALFSVLRGTLQTVVLNACSTKRIARELQKVVDYTIAMNGPIYDIAAVAFAKTFYDALAQGMHVPAAFEAGIAQLHVTRLPSKSRPELFIAPGVGGEGFAADAEDPIDSVDSPSRISIKKSRVGRMTIVSGTGHRVRG